MHTQTTGKGCRNGREWSRDLSGYSKRLHKRSAHKSERQLDRRAEREEVTS